MCLTATAFSTAVGIVVENIWSGDGALTSASAHLPDVRVRREGGFWTALTYLDL